MKALGLRALWLLLLGALSAPVGAAVELRVGVKRLEAPEATIQGLHGRLTLQDDGRRSLELGWDRLSLPDMQEPLPLRGIACADSSWSAERFSCIAGRLQPGDVPLSLEWRRTEGEQRLEMDFSSAGGPKSRLEFTQAAGRYRLQVESDGAALAPLLRGFLPALEGWQLAGRLDFEAEWSGHGAPAEWRLDFSELSFSGPLGGYAGEGLAGRLQGDLDGAAGEHRFRLEAGALLTPYFYFEPAGNPLELHAQSAREPGGGWTFDQGALSGSGLPELRGRLVLSEAWGVQELEVEGSDLDLDVLYRRLLQPVLAATALEQAEVAGRADLHWRMGGDGGRVLDLRVRDGRLADRRGGASRFDVQGLFADLNWRSDGPGRASLGWKSAALWERFALAGGMLNFRTDPAGARLEEAVSLAFLGGQLSLAQLALDFASGPPLATFSADLSGLDLVRFSEAADWFPVPGQAAVALTAGRYQGGELTVDGHLDVAAFGGRIEARRIHAAGLLGVLPTLEADLALRRLDLQRLTQAFSFGKITGLLDGEVEGLYLENWRPIAFDARLYNPEDDPKPHRISQRALDNLTDLGGSGVSGALSRGFLRMFDTFHYDRLGFGCELHDGVCAMSGVEPAENGYYLVKGGGLPRVSVVGINRRIDWGQLIEKLARIAESGPPVVN